MRIHSIFTSLEGEGLDAGKPTIFVRLQGCRVRCSWCDTPEAMSIGGGQEYTLEQVVEKIRRLHDQTGITRVSFTGGDPSLQLLSIEDVVKRLRKEYKGVFSFHLEHTGLFDTSGSAQKFNACKTVLGILSCFDTVCFDLKTPSSGVYPPEVMESFATHAYFSSTFSKKKGKTGITVKAVIATHEDAEFVRRIARSITPKSVHDDTIEFCTELIQSSHISSKFGKLGKHVFWFVFRLLLRLYRSRLITKGRVTLLISPCVTDGKPASIEGGLAEFVTELSRDWKFGEVRASAQMHKYLSIQ